MATFSDIGIPIKKTLVGEGDLLLDILTQNHGRVDALAKGATKLLSRKRGNIEIGSIAVFHLAEGRTRYIIVEAEMKNGLLALRKMRDGIEWIWWICKLAHHLFRTGKEEFDVLAHTLTWVDKTAELIQKKRHGDILPLLKRVKTWFSLKALAITGFIESTPEVLEVTEDLKSGVLLLGIDEKYRRLNSLTQEIMKDIMS